MSVVATEETNLSALKNRIFHGEEGALLYYTLDFVEWDAQTISLYQQTCKANREWRSEELGVMKDEWEERWKAIEKIVGKGTTDKMKQGAALETLCLEDYQISDKGCEALAPALPQMTALKELDLSANEIGDKGCEALAPALSQMTALEKLDLYWNQIGAKGCEALAPALPQMTALETLNLNKNKIGDKECEAYAPALAQMPALKRLSLWGNPIGDKGKTMMREAWKNAGKDRKYLNF